MKRPLPRPAGITDFIDLNRAELAALIASLEQNPGPEAFSRVIDFFVAETRGLGHGRARAKLSRRLKHHEISVRQRQRLLDCILGRLEKGLFSEQFKDQLRLAGHLDPGQTLKVCTNCLSSPIDHVRRNAQWVISRYA